TLQAQDDGSSEQSPTPPEQDSSSTDQGFTPSDAQPGACVVQEEIPANRSAITNRYGQLRQTFEMNIDWRNSPRRAGSYCDCACGEYRQYIKGHLIINGVPQKEKLWGGAVLEENVYHEDGRENDPDARYGHRDEPQKMDEQFIVDRPTGCSY